MELDELREGAEALRAQIGRVVVGQERAVELLPVFQGVFATQGCLLVKAGLAARGFAPGGVRKPLLAASPAQAATFVALLDAAGL